MFDKLYILDRRFQEVATRYLPKFPVTSASIGPQRETKGTSYLEVAQVGVLALWATPQLLILMSFKSQLVQATYHNAVTLCSFHRYYFFFFSSGQRSLGARSLGPLVFSPHLSPRELWQHSKWLNMAKTRPLQTKKGRRGHVCIVIYAQPYHKPACIPIKIPKSMRHQLANIASLRSSIPQNTEHFISWLHMKACTYRGLQLITQRNNARRELHSGQPRATDITPPLQAYHHSFLPPWHPLLLKLLSTPPGLHKLWHFKNRAQQ